MQTEIISGKKKKDENTLDDHAHTANHRLKHRRIFKDQNKSANFNNKNAAEQPYIQLRNSRGEHNSAQLNSTNREEERGRDHFVWYTGEDRRRRRGGEMACLNTLKLEIKTLERTFTKNHDRFRILHASVDELTCRFIGKNGKNYDIHANITVIIPHTYTILLFRLF